MYKYGFDKKDVRILLALDDKFFRNRLHLFLGQEGYEIVSVPDGQAAIHALSTTFFDMVILALHRSSMDGEAVCIEIRKRSDILIILLTRTIRREEVIRGLWLGADRCLAKPFQLDILSARIHAALRQTQQRKQHIG